MTSSSLNLYYRVKPFLPWSVRIGARRWLARRRRHQFEWSWPIRPGSEVAPPEWLGWPDGRRFAFVLTHDVEGPEGLNRCRRLMELEARLGFRSSFNFIPEGSYRTPPELRATLRDAGFEVGVHDLNHDGRLYRSRAAFLESAERINRYLQEWNAVGFRSGFMLREMNWLHNINIQYDGSTFDTDPFEPQPEGVNTIFPFWVPAPFPGFQAPHSEARHSELGVLHSRPASLPLRTGVGAGVGCDPVVPGSRPDLVTLAPHPSPLTPRPQRPGYVELPYTLPQDSTLFLLLKEKSNAIWKRKLDWIVEHSGMALLNVHPDYLAFEGESTGPGRFPVAHYQEFLQYVKKRYEGEYWNALPCEVATLVSTRRNATASAPSSSPPAVPRPTRPVKIWIDLDNTPHVPFFIPIIRELERRGHRVFLTARDAFQVCQLADQKGLPYVRVGRHYGKNRIMKVAGLLWRSAQLLPSFIRQRPALAVSHGARSQIFLANLARVPTVLILDYEFAKTPPMVRPRWRIVPEALPDSGSDASRPSRVLRYRGIKEDVYAPEFLPDPRLLDELGLDAKDLVITVRPPANEAHYHNPESEQLLVALMDRICRSPGVRAVMLPRNQRQGDTLRAAYPQWFAENRTIVPARAVDGLNLLWYSDLVVSGGGTMNREAAALGIPVFSIFRGRTGAVDLRLEEEGRLTMIRTPEEVETRIPFTRRDKSIAPDNAPRAALTDIVDHIEEIIRQEC